MVATLSEHEIEYLSHTFPHTKAPLEFDYKDFELKAMADLGVLQNHPHVYLGKLVFIFFCK